MIQLAPYAIPAWMVVAVAAFPSFRPVRALVLLVLSGTLFLPEAVLWVVELGPVKLTKPNAVAYAALLATLMHQPGRLSAVRPRWFDLPMAVLSLWALPSALLNPPPPDGSLVRDALAQTLGSVMCWGVPYLLGRAYFTDRAAVRELAVGLVVGAAVYAPLCLWEARMAPVLHATVYGVNQHDFSQTMRFGGYRPMVFLPHGLAVGLFMSAGALLAVWLRRPLGLPGYLILLVPTAVVVKSTGAIVLGLAGGAALWLGAAGGRRAGLLALAALPAAYAGTRATGLWSGRELVTVTAAAVEDDRARSLDFRLYNENLLIAKALERPLTGWGGWGRFFVYLPDGSNSVPDGLWVIILGDRGVVAVVAFGAAMLLPVVRLARRADPAAWRTPELAPALGCAAVLALWALDCLFNAMVLPVYPLLAGALADPDSALAPPADPAEDIGGHRLG